MKTLMTLGAVLFIVAGVTMWVVMSNDGTSPSVEIVTEPTSTTTKTVRFVSPQTNEVVTVSFAESVAVLNGAGYQNLSLVQVEAASGAKYESAAENISIWNSGDELTLYRGRQVKFVGNTEASLTTTNPTPAATVSTSTTPVALAGTTWVWKESTAADGTVVTPATSGAFTITFATDGTLQGTTDCNGFSGAYTQTESMIESGPFAMTKMFCEGSQEMEFTTFISGNTSFVRDESNPTQLTLTNSAGVTRLVQQ